MKRLVIRGVDLYTFGWALGPPNPDFGPPNVALGPPNVATSPRPFKQVLLHSTEDTGTVAENEASAPTLKYFLRRTGKNNHYSDELQPAA